jgi:archaellum component FlaC
MEIKARDLIPVIQDMIDKAASLEQMRSVLAFVAESETVAKEAEERKDKLLEEVKVLRAEKEQLDEEIQASRKLKTAEDEQFTAERIRLEKGVADLKESVKTLEAEHERAVSKVRAWKEQVKKLVGEE